MTDPEPDSAVATAAAPACNARLTRVVLRNYRSIAGCDVRLGALTFLVGPNGAGKSKRTEAGAGRGS